MLTEADTHLTVPEGRLEIEVFARQLRAAIGERNDTGERGDGWRVAAAGAVEAQIRRVEARRVATRVGRGMLAATDLDTARHADDVVLLAGAICHVVGIRGAERQDVLAAAHLHDIGKAAVRRAVIEKPGPLSRSEWRLMRAHTEVGARILAVVPELDGIARLVRHSHERWDGDGYPDGLSGERIPLGSRVIFCADAFHAIRADRPYRRGRSAAYALAELRACSGTQFDPEVVVALERVARELRIAPPTRRMRGSSRLTALLLCLTLGGTGSAIAHSDLLGEPSAAAPAPATVTSDRHCQTLVCSTPLAPSAGTGFAQAKPSKRRAQGKGQGETVAGAGLAGSGRGSTDTTTRSGSRRSSSSGGGAKGHGGAQPRGEGHALGKSKGDGHPLGGAPGRNGAAPPPISNAGGKPEAGSGNAAGMGEPASANGAAGQGK